MNHLKIASIVNHLKKNLLSPRPKAKSAPKKSEAKKVEEIKP